MTKQVNKEVLLDSVDKTGTTLRYAVSLQRLAAQAGFDWPNINGVVDKVKEELEEVIAETSLPNNQERLQDEIGDLLFACTNLARHVNVDPELALISGNKKFYHRFSSLEKLLEQQNKNINETTLEELNQLWEQVKRTR